MGMRTLYELGALRSCLEMGLQRHLSLLIRTAGRDWGLVNQAGDFVNNVRHDGSQIGLIEL
jgi:hypothetical protein